MALSIFVCVSHAMPDWLRLTWTELNRVYIYLEWVEHALRKDCHPDPAIRAQINKVVFVAGLYVDDNPQRINEDLKTQIIIIGWRSPGLSLISTNEGTTTLIGLLGGCLPEYTLGKLVDVASQANREDVARSNGDVRG